jgi:dTDP-4-dehydrorhamnose reductase
LVTFSSDLVFDGAKDEPYTEADAPAPLNVYGRSKAEAEARVAAINPGALIVRTSAFFGPWDDFNFVTRLLRGLKAGEECTALDNVVVSPTYVPDLVDASLDLLIDGECGLWHLANGGAVTWLEFARRAAAVAGLDGSGIAARGVEELELPARRPQYSVLRSERGTMLPTLEHALARYLEESGWRREIDGVQPVLAEQLGA